jgi:hypothetical protein
MKINELLLEAIHKHLLVQRWRDEDTLKQIEAVIDFSNKALSKPKEDEEAYESLLSTKAEFERQIVSTKEEMKDIELVVNRIEKECSKYLKIFDNTSKVLYRGTSSTGAVFEGESIENRRTKDSNTAKTVEYDTILKSLGIEARRSNSIFTTSDRSQANRYGNTMYVIIPKNTAVYSWSRQQKDVVLDKQVNFIKHPIKLQNIIKKEMSATRSLFRTGSDVKSKLLYKYLDYLDDILYIFSLSKFPLYFEWIAKYFPKSPILKYVDILLNPTAEIKQFQMEYQITDKDFKLALASGYEVLIHGQYFAIKNENYMQFREVRRKLGYIK